MKRAALVALVLLAGCGGGGGGDDGKAPSQAELVRGWIGALNAGDYRRAASYFADGAVVEQTAEIVLRSDLDKLAFNRSLPCRADITDIDRDGAGLLVAFRLRRGPGGCAEGGAARVRFRFAGGKFSEWRQLAEPTAPQGPVV